jgi:hypothetical protein
MNDARPVLKYVPAVAIQAPCVLQRNAERGAAGTQREMNSGGTRLLSCLPHRLGHFSGAPYQRAIDIDSNERNQRFNPRE